MISYLITDPAHYTRNPIRFKKRLLRSISLHHPTYIALRDKNNPKLAKIAFRLKKMDNLVINQDYRLARRAGIKNVHLTSSQIELAKRLRRSGFRVWVSAHDEAELALARRYRVHFVTFSPIFPTPGKGAPVGTKRLRHVVKKYGKNILALGGVVKKRQIRRIARTKAAGFASIRYFI